MVEAFKPGRLNYTANVAPDKHTIEIIPTTTSRRASSLTVNGSEATSGQAYEIAVKDKDQEVAIQVVAPDGTTTKVYSLTVI
ncbi:MAG: cadherin-like beta sandwich domain-containing protein [Anaerolineae bacterium]|nr:cadherin-like beta sandwich domain-containing protein [Anaerolineae bacterium]